MHSKSRKKRRLLMLSCGGKHETVRVNEIEYISQVIHYGCGVCVLF